MSRSISFCASDFSTGSGLDCLEKLEGFKDGFCGVWALLEELVACCVMLSTELVELPLEQSSGSAGGELAGLYHGASMSRGTFGLLAVIDCG